MLWPDAIAQLSSRQRLSRSHRAAMPPQLNAT
jgi:hypothetical protein